MISAIIVAYNEEEYFESIIHEIRSQTFKGEYEIILADGGSSDQTVKIKTPPIIVSARRHEKAGFVKTRLQWIVIRELYKLGVAPKKLAKLYRDVRWGC